MVYRLSIEVLRDMLLAFAIFFFCRLGTTCWLVVKLDNQLLGLDVALLSVLVDGSCISELESIFKLCADAGSRNLFF